MSALLLYSRWLSFYALIYMISPRDVYYKIQEISSKYISGKPPIHVDMLVDELGINKSTLEPILYKLEDEGKIQFYESSHSALSLTYTVIGDWE